MRCEDCDGEIDEKTTIPLKTGCSVLTTCLLAHPCKNCGLLHLADGRAARNAYNNKAFYKNNKIVIKES